MSDITYCENNKCLFNSICERYIKNTHVPLFSSYFNGNLNNNDCEYFIGDYNQKELISINEKRKSKLNEIFKTKPKLKL